MKIFILKAFTLVEVLITLSIIGVVAALTIPALHNEIQNRQFKETAKEVFSKSSQAVQQMKMDEGGSLDYSTKTNGSFFGVFMNYFKIIKICAPVACVPEVSQSDIYTSLFGDKADATRGGEGEFVTADGVFFNIQNSINAPLEIIVDVNGYTKKPNVYGQDVFMFELVNDNLLPMGAKATSLLAPTYCNPKVSNGLQGVACMQYVMQGIDY